MKKFLVYLVALMMPACGGLPELPCPPLCPPEPGAPYDCANPPAAANQFLSAAGWKDGKVMIVLKKSSDRAGNPTLTPSTVRVDAIAQRLEARFSGLSNVQSFGALGQLVAEANLATVLEILKDPDVAYVSPVRTYAVEKPAEVQATASWGTDRINQRDLPLDGNDDPGSTGEGVAVVIIDTGVSDHPDFTGRLSSDCFSAITFGGCSDMHGHGTHVAGTTSGETFGIASKATIYSSRVLDQNGSGTTDQVVAGINWALQLKQRLGAQPVVANMSLGGSPDPPLDQAVCDAIAGGVQFGIAAGNDESQTSYDSSPARVLQAVTVAASDRNDKPAYFSSQGPGVDVWAPGVDIVSSKPSGGSQVMSGTSMAAPHVTGTLALFFQRNPSATPAQAQEWIVTHATPGKIGGTAETTQALLYDKEN